MQQIQCKDYLRPSTKGNKKMEIKIYICSKDIRVWQDNLLMDLHDNVSLL